MSGICRLTGQAVLEASSEQAACRSFGSPWLHLLFRRSTGHLVIGKPSIDGYGASTSLVDLHERWNDGVLIPR